MSEFQHNVFKLFIPPVFKDGDRVENEQGRTGTVKVPGLHPDAITVMHDTIVAGDTVFRLYRHGDLQREGWRDSYLRSPWCLAHEKRDPGIVKQNIMTFLQHLRSKFDGSSKWLLFILALMWGFSLYQGHWIEMAITTLVVGAWYVLGSWTQFRKLK
jgi:hypothetical protein